MEPPLNPITSLDAGTGLCLHIARQRPGASEFCC